MWKLCPEITFEIFNGKDRKFYYDGYFYYYGGHDNDFKCTECRQTHKKLYDELKKYLK